MIVGAFVVLFAVFFYLLIRGAARMQDQMLEDREQMAYLYRYAQRKNQRKRRIGIRGGYTCTDTDLPE